MAIRIVLAVATFSVASARHGLRRVPSPPSTTGYDPVELLCTHGKDVQPWCKSWMECIKSKAVPEGTPEAVMKAWKPADCREYCGVWPETTPKEGAKKAAALTALTKGKKGACLANCASFQESLTTCVSYILFEPGKINTMKGPEVKSKSGGICDMKDTPCMPDLAIRSQKCLLHKTKEVLGKKMEEEKKDECKMINSNYEDCKDCPQLQGDYGSQYHAFVGGCIDQLNSYWQATHPSAGGSAIPGAAGCSVH